MSEGKHMATESELLRLEGGMAITCNGTQITLDTKPVKGTGKYKGMVLISGNERGDESTFEQYLSPELVLTVKIGW